MNLSLSSSIFTSAYYHNYIFYLCPMPKFSLAAGFIHINCLSTDSETVVASASVSPTDNMTQVYGCTIITSAKLPVSWLGSTCAICLEDYLKERIECIILCQHCFHANCIEQWLRKNWSCDQFAGLLFFLNV
ncbi:uncharacterized protein [Primulina eburnea]|uniref:uncharacterized protein n=1 Tax=Primulina eburnea TaxID=1245227 RepID=UPI003C6C3523